MGGDDLESDDEYLTTKVVAENDSSDDEEGSSHEDVQIKTATEKTTARRHNISDHPEQGTPKKSKTSIEARLMDEARSLHLKSAVDQAAFLSMALKNYVLFVKNEKIIDSNMICADNLKTSKLGSFLERLKDVSPMKKMKKWKYTNSPCVVSQE
jgi:hypothetical protein